MQGPSDHFLQHGYRNKCVCGGYWYDSDVRPCHEKCEHCDKIYNVDDGPQCKCNETEREEDEQ